MNPFRNRFFLVLIFIVGVKSFVFSQEDKLSFQFKMVTNNLQTVYSLSHGNGKSHWSELQDPELVTQDINYIKSDNYQRKHLFKDFTNGWIYTDYKVWGGAKFYVKDPIDLQTWETIDSTEVVLKYVCNMAKTTFRGRTYIASYTTEIPIADGPFKFQGLPGMILKVKSIEGNENFVMECVGIAKTRENIKEKFNKYVFNENRKFVDWKTFTVNVKDFFDKNIKRLQSAPNSDGGSMATIKTDIEPEIFNRELQTTGITFVF